MKKNSSKFAMNWNEKDKKVSLSLNLISTQDSLRLPMAQFPKKTEDYLKNIASTDCPMCAAGIPVVLKKQVKIGNNYVWVKVNE